VLITKHHLRIFDAATLILLNKIKFNYKFLFSKIHKKLNSCYFVASSTFLMLDVESESFLTLVQVLYHVFPSSALGW
jgi:hypothetical protein